MCLFHVGSFNAEYPLEVDDDFWENDDPQYAFVQPSDNFHHIQPLASTQLGGNQPCKAW